MVWVRGEREKRFEMTHRLGGDLEEFADKMGHRDQGKEAEKTKKKHGILS